MVSRMPVSLAQILAQTRETSRCLRAIKARVGASSREASEAVYAASSFYLKNVRRRKPVRARIRKLPWTRSEPLPNTLPILLADSDLLRPL